MIASASVQRKIASILASKPSVLAIIGEPGAGKTFAASYVATEILGISSLETYPHYWVLDAKESGIQEVRELQKELALAVPSSKQISRVVVVQNFDSFKHEAQNSMLKMLEEPPLSTMIILTIENDQNVLPTIFSRVQRLYIPPINLALALESFSNLAPAVVTKAFYVSGGNTGLLYKILHVAEETVEVSSIARARELLTASKFERIAQVDSLIKDKKQPISEVLYGLVKLIHASARQSVEKTEASAIITKRYNQLEIVMKCLEDLQKGTNTKLAMTKMFLAL